MEREGWPSLILAVLATWRVTHLLAMEDGPGNLIVALRRRLGDGFFGNMIDCFNCLSLWIAALIACLFANTWREWPLLRQLLREGLASKQRLPLRVGAAKGCGASNRCQAADHLTAQYLFGLLVERGAGRQRNRARARAGRRSLQVLQYACDRGFGKGFKVADALNAKAQNPLNLKAGHPHAKVAARVRRGLGNDLSLAAEREEPNPRNAYREQSE